MLDLNQFFCANENCQLYGQRGQGNIRKYGYYGPHRRQVLQCKVCKKTFSETKHTAFFGSRYSADTIRKIVLSIAEGNGIRATARLLGLSKDSVNKVVKKAGAHCGLVMQELLHDLHLEQCQLDELCSFVKKNPTATGTYREVTGASGAGSR